MSYPDDRQYTADHEWIAVDGDTARVGITAYAAEALGDVVYLDLPEVGATLTAGETCGEIESTKSVSDLIAPADGEVTSVNQEAVDAPETVNADPESGGWFAKVKVSDPSQYEALMDRPAYEAFLETQ